jgi:hypothetical protein
MRKQMTQAARVVRASWMSTEPGMDVAIPEGELAFDPRGGPPNPPLHRTASASVLFRITWSTVGDWFPGGR